MLANGTQDRGTTQRTNGQDAGAAPPALYREAEFRRGGATETWWSTWSLTAMTSGANGPCGSSMRGEKPHQRGEGPGGRLGKPCCGEEQNGQTGRRAETFLSALPPINLGVHLLAEAARGTRFHARAAASVATT